MESENVRVLHLPKSELQTADRFFVVQLGPESIASLREGMVIIVHQLGVAVVILAAQEGEEFIVSIDDGGDS